MHCKACNTDKKASDFLLNQTECYRCIYKRKISRSEKLRKNSLCKVCGGKCEKNRWAYCSEGCSKIGMAQQKKEHWTAKLRKVGPF